MKPEERYIDEVLRHVFATAEDRERLATDLRSHFVEGEATGRTAQDIIAGLGTPEEVAAAFNAEREFRYAGFWQRLLAFLADIGLMALCGLPAVGLLFLSGVLPKGESGPSILGLFAIGLVVLALAGLCIFYFPLLESHFGKTLGKHLLRLRVLRENGAPIGLGQAFVRRLSMFFDMLWVDALFIPFTDKKQRALDIVAKTVVAREPNGGPSMGSYLLCLILALAPFCGLAFLIILCGQS